MPTADGPEPVDDDPTIPDEELLLHWVPAFVPNLLARDSETNEIIGPTSAAFAPDTDGVSVYLTSILQESNLSAKDVTHAATDSVWELLVGDVRHLDLGIRRDAWPQDVDDPEHPRHAAHALITGLIGLPKNARIRAQRQLSKVPSLRCIFEPDDPLDNQR